MVDKLSGVYSPLSGRVDGSRATTETQRRPERVNIPPSGPGFADVLANKTGEVRFSAHAQERLRTRHIEFSPQDHAALAKAVDAAGAKGGQESLILMNDLALVVSVRNRVVITALAGQGQEPEVFTHIDSAVVAPKTSH
jgi:flagellar operon protein